MTGVSAFDSDHPDVEIVAVPEPFWVRTPRTLFRWRRQCVACPARPTFRTAGDWCDHYIRVHFRA